MAACESVIPCITHDEESSRQLALDHCSVAFEKLSVQERVQWSLENLPGKHIVSSSFGAHAAVSLHLLTQIQPDIPVVLIDTGYLFPETYTFADQLCERLSLKLKVYRATLSPAWQESRFGRLWAQGVAGIQHYNQLNKVEPMARALKALQAGTWFSGLRRSQSDSRRRIGIVQPHGEVVKVHPLADWTDRDIHSYLKTHDLPYHPMREKGYFSIGDRHSSLPLSAADSVEETRFNGLVRECGLHEPERFKQLNKIKLEK